LICLYVFSHQDFDAHYTSSARIDFALRTLDVLRHDLKELGIPLWIEEVAKRKTLADQVLQWCEKWGVSHVFGNMEYEVDELRRDTQLVKKGAEMGIAVDILHDTCIVRPGLLHAVSCKNKRRDKDRPLTFMMIRGPERSTLFTVHTSKSGSLTSKKTRSSTYYYLHQRRILIMQNRNLPNSSKRYHTQDPLKIRGYLQTTKRD